MTWGYALHDLAIDAPGGTGRILHGLARRSPVGFAGRVAAVGLEVALGTLRDVVQPLRRETLAIAEGRVHAAGASLALYLHWSPDGRISALVRRQVALWRQAGFAVVFVTNATPPAGDWDAIGEDTVLRLRRANVGRDFGAWRDAAAIALRHLPDPTELLLANDSVLGPFLPLDPLIAAWRDGGAGLFGMTESLGGGAHLQSYALLARGAAAVAALVAHLAVVPDRRSKWRMVQAGELGLSRRMATAGHRCAGLFGYAAACAALSPAERRALGPRFADPEAFRRFPLNPTHHLWRPLVERLGFPYLKTELIRNNPGRLPGVERWPELMPADQAGLIRAHLAVMAGR